MPLCSECPRRSFLPRQLGQSSMEYVVVCAALAFALGIGMRSGNDSVLLELLLAFQTAYERFSYAISLPD